MPNLHPLVVHFPIALFLVGFVLDGLGWGLRNEAFKRVGWVLVLLGALAAVPAVVTGLAVEETVEEQLEPLPGGGEALEAHEELAIPTAGVLLTAALLRFLLEIRLGSRGVTRGLLAVYLIAGLVGVGMLTVTGLRGGELVYRYGAGVQTDALYVRPLPSDLRSETEMEMELGPPPRPAGLPGFPLFFFLSSPSLPVLPLPLCLYFCSLLRLLLSCLQGLIARSTRVCTRAGASLY